MGSGSGLKSCIVPPAPALLESPLQAERMGGAGQGKRRQRCRAGIIYGVVPSEVGSV